MVLQVLIQSPNLSLYKVVNNWTVSLLVSQSESINLCYFYGKNDFTWLSTNNHYRNINSYHGDPSQLHILLRRPFTRELRNISYWRGLNTFSICRQHWIFDIGTVTLDSPLILLLLWHKWVCPIDIIYEW